MSSSFFREQSLSWDALQPQLTTTETEISPMLDFWALQPNVRNALSLFLRNQNRSLMVLKADDKPDYAALLMAFVQQTLPKVRSVFGVNYVVEQGDSFSFPHIEVEPAQSLEDNFATSGEVLSALYCDQFQLFGKVKVHPGSQDIQLTPGLIHRANGGVLILSASTLLAQFDLWQRLKHILQTQQFDWFSAHPFKTLPCEIPSYPLNVKVIILGNRAELATLGELEEDLYDFADYAEIESYLSVVDVNEQKNWASYVQKTAKENNLELDFSAVNKIYQLLVRESENRFLVKTSPATLKNMLLNAAILAQKTDLSAVDFEAVFQQQIAQHGFLKEQTYADILNEQVYVETDGEIVGQVNGLSVIEYPGTPVAFGEPSRISCIVQFGDGEVIDVERKNELAGNIHSKGMMIAQACLSNILEFPSQLPFSASLVFEQSYGEIDGDSASLAIFCVLVSALADLPLPQYIAMTGSIDQFGLIHAVGGVNDKIEGFFTICQRRGLTGKQGVIIPATTIQQLSLSEEVVSAVKNGEFFIFPVEDIYQACELIFQRDLLEEDKIYEESKTPISRLIQRRIDIRAEPVKKGFLDFLRF
ncbi:AAA family ATPase [Rodentibacter trehalosifermentans]|uniref:endopeptidase La n=1 Tax=Rodentibacter trehalosifermentans TaxID=1908263 RepID=A0A1V3IVF3_9PAST|nr:Lon protease family protein [Rodentibacter trehalosifermentans]OOF46052.1 peptidase [Rodentibacter trehalosifermentans]OOF49834.1 peptidase [Rodentibacter trehalosifermentans]OOF51409.1 peptidase [Rodentibacter trehalosifermentans]